LKYGGNPDLVIKADDLVAMAETHKTQPLAAHGEIGNGRKDESRADNVRSTGFGNSQAYLMRPITPALEPRMVKPKSTSHLRIDRQLA